MQQSKGVDRCYGLKNKPVRYSWLWTNATFQNIHSSNAQNSLLSLASRFPHARLTLASRSPTLTSRSPHAHLTLALRSPALALRALRACLTHPSRSRALASRSPHPRLTLSRLRLTRALRSPHARLTLPRARRALASRPPHTRLIFFRIMFIRASIRFKASSPPRSTRTRLTFTSWSPRTPPLSTHA